MTILFTRFPLESTLGGAEIQTLSLMDGLRARGHDVRFLGSCPVLLAECRKRGIPATELNLGPPPVTKWGALSFLWRQGSMRQKLLEQPAIRNSQFAIFLSLSEKLLLTESATKNDVRILWLEHDRIGRWLTWNPWLPRLRRLSRLATTICVSELSRKLYVNLGWPEEKTIAIPNGIDLQKFLSPATSHKPLATGFSIGTVSRLSSEKGIDVLVRAAARVPDTQLTIVGKGREEPRLRALIASLSLTGRVTIVPTVDDLPAFYRSLDLFVLPSRDNDPFGLAAAEAMASGIATIVTDQCGIAGSLTDGKDALVVHAGDAASLADAIGKLKTDESTRRSIADGGRRTAEAAFGVEAMVEHYVALLERT